MINQALLHFPKVGPKRRQQLADNGIQCWQSVVENADGIPSSIRDHLVAESERCIAALQAEDLSYFTRNLHPEDRWRILHQFLPAASFFDIETTGLEHDDTISTIACWHNGRVHHFVEHENLDDFLELLDEIQLLVSFNGSTFDVPRTLATFHIPELPCPHLDLRWPCFHHGLSGGLKQVADSIGIRRPADIAQADGQLAILLWERWQNHRDLAAKEKLLRYCAADVLLLRPVAAHVAKRDQNFETLWDDLAPIQNSSSDHPTEKRIRNQVTSSLFGSASPKRLRTRRRA